jgi:hypothetical protein
VKEDVVDEYPCIEVVNWKDIKYDPRYIRLEDMPPNPEEVYWQIEYRRDEERSWQMPGRRTFDDEFKAMEAYTNLVARSSTFKYRLVSVTKQVIS